MQGLGLQTQGRGYAVGAGLGLELMEDDRPDAGGRFSCKWLPPALGLSNRPVVNLVNGPHDFGLTLGV